jgi:hypothetical protein
LLTLLTYVLSSILLASIAFWVAEATDEHDGPLDYTDPDLLIPPPTHKE